MPRWHVGCDVCDAGGWIGARPGGVEAWCEGCQTSAVLADGQGDGPCGNCGLALTTTEPRFEELFGELQNLDAVLAAWDGDSAPLAAILPERPRYLTDLTPPPERPDDPPAARAGLERLARGAFTAARVELEAWLAESGQADARGWLAFGIAAQRTAELAIAESAYGRALDRDPELVAARLDRGALRARRGDYAGARDDFARAGNGREARWNRAAAAVLEAVAVTPGLPNPAVLRAARAEAGAPNAYWSEHTIGRLLWTALVERARSRGAEDAAACVDGRVLRAAEAELEFRTFWDRALVVHGYAVLGMAKEAAAPLALELLQELRGEPALAGPAGAELAVPLAEALAGASASSPASARAALARLLARDDLRHYRVPCRTCGRGTLGVDAVEDRPGASAESDEPSVNPSTGELAG